MKDMAVKGEEGEKNFIWVDGEASLLLRVVMDFQAQKSSQRLDSEKVKNRPEDKTTLKMRIVGCHVKHS